MTYILPTQKDAASNLGRFKVLQNMLGHKDAAETLNTYADLLPDRVDEISAALDTARAAAIKPGA